MSEIRTEGQHEDGGCELTLDFEDTTAVVFTRNDEFATNEPTEICISMPEFAALVKAIRALPESVIARVLAEPEPVAGDNLRLLGLKGKTR